MFKEWALFVLHLLYDSELFINNSTDDCQIIKKEMKDNTVEWDCKCCGKNCDTNKKDYYMIKDDLWEKVYPQTKGMLCMDCLEGKLGRKLTKSDILVCHLTKNINPYTRAILNDKS